jgi:hypothetical protein
MLAIRTTSNCLELPVARVESDGVSISPMVTPEYLDFVVSHANAKFEANAARSNMLHDVFLSAVSEAQASQAAVSCAECAPAEEADPHTSAGRDRGRQVVPTPPTAIEQQQQEQQGAPVEMQSAPGLDHGLRPGASPQDQAGAEASLRCEAGNAAARKVRHFCNLSNGIEAVASLIHKCGVPGDEIRFVRIQSSHCEAKDYAGVLSNLDHDFLLHLALGYQCRVYDFGSRAKRWPSHGLDLMVPSAIWWGLEITRYALTKLWHLSDGGERLVLHGHDATELVEQVIQTLPKPVSRKLRYYRNFVSTDTLRLDGIFAQTDLDGKREELGRQLWTNYVLCDTSRSNALESPLPPGMQVFEAERFGLTSGEERSMTVAP